jgi:hypothetical protein
MLHDHLEDPTAIRTQFGAIFVSLELSRKTWLIASLSPGKGEKMSKRGVAGGDVAGLLWRFAELRSKAAAQTGQVFPLIVIQEAGLDGFWLHRLLEREGFESHGVDPASIAVPRRGRRAKTDKIDGEALLRALLAYKRGEPRVCSMVVAPSPEEEDERRLCPRAQDADRRAGRPRQSDQGSSVRAGDAGLCAAVAQSEKAARGDRRRRRAGSAGACEGADRARTRPAGDDARSDQGGGEGAQSASLSSASEGRQRRGSRVRREAAGRGEADGLSRDRGRLGGRPMVGGAVADLLQSAAARGLRRLCADAVAERLDRP